MIFNENIMTFRDDLTIYITCAVLFMITLATTVIITITKIGSNLLAVMSFGSFIMACLLFVISGLYMSIKYRKNTRYKKFLERYYKNNNVIEYSDDTSTDPSYACLSHNIHNPSKWD